MNSIQVTHGTSKYSTERHLIIQVNSITLDHYFHEIHSQHEINGFVPTLLPRYRANFFAVCMTK